MTMKLHEHTQKALADMKAPDWDNIADRFPGTDMAWHGHCATRFAGPFVGNYMDRIDVDPIVIGHAAPKCGYTQRQFYEIPELGAHCVAYCNELYDLLPVTHWFYSNVWLDSLGAPMEVTDKLPYIIPDGIPNNRPAEKPENVEKLEVPDVDELEKSLSGQLYIRAWDYCKEKIPHMFVPIHFGFCLYSMSAEMAEPNNFLMWAYTQPEMCHKLLQTITDTSINAAIMIANRYGFAMMTPGGVLSNTTVLKANLVKELAVDYHRQLVRKSFRGGAGPQLWYHLCGDHSLDFELWKEVMISPFTVMHIGYDGKDVFPAKKLVDHFGNLMTVMASVDTILLNDGPPKKVYDAMKPQIEGLLGAPRGFIMGAACEVPTFAPPSSILSMVRAARDFGKLD
jgi:uroporphyrinogen decarboxylase